MPGAGRKLKTTTYTVRPVFWYPKPGAAATISGYRATNIVDVTLDDLAQVGKVIDAATQSGANVIQNLDYQLKSPGAIRARALRQAAEQAKISAEAIAAGLGLKVLRVLSAEPGPAGREFRHEEESSSATFRISTADADRSRNDRHRRKCVVEG